MIVVILPITIMMVDRGPPNHLIGNLNGICASVTDIFATIRNLCLRNFGICKFIQAIYCVNITRVQQVILLLTYKYFKNSYFVFWQNFHRFC